MESFDDPPPPYNPEYVDRNKLGNVTPAVVKQLASSSSLSADTSPLFYEAVALYYFTFADMLVLLRSARVADSRAEIMRILSPSILPLNLSQVLELIETVSLTDALPRLRILQFSLPALAQNGPLSEADVSRLGTAFPAGARSTAFGLILHGHVRSLSATKIFELMNSVPSEARQALLRSCLPFLSAPYSSITMLGLLRLIPSTSIAESVQLIHQQIEVLTSFTILAEFVRLADEASGRLLTFRLLTQRLGTSTKWDGLPELISAMNVNDRLPVLHAALQLNVNGPRASIDLVAQLLHCFPETSLHRVTCIQLLAPKFAPAMTCDELMICLSLFNDKLKKNALIAAAAAVMIESLPSTSIAAILSDIPENYSQRLDSLRALAPRLVGGTTTGALPILTLFENKTQRLAALGILAPLLSDARDKAAATALISRAFSPSEKQRALDVLSAK